MADMITRCPKCGTAFRISEALLKSAKGVVRCGSCLSVFNARDHLETGGAAVPQPPAPTSDTPPQESLSAPAPPPTQPEPFSPPSPLTNVEEDEVDLPDWRRRAAPEEVEDRLADTDPLPQPTEDDSEEDDEAWALELLKEDDDEPNIQLKKVTPVVPEPAPIAEPSLALEDETLPPPPLDVDDALAEIDEQLAPLAPPPIADDTEESFGPPAAEPASGYEETLGKEALREKTWGLEPDDSADAEATSEVAKPWEEPEDEPEDEPDEEPKSLNEPPPEPPVEPPKRKPIRPKLEPKSTPLKEVIASLEPEPLEVEWQEPGAWRRRLLWPLLALVALLCLLAQVAWLEFDRLSRIEPYRSVYGVACRVIGCELPELQDRRQIQTSNLLVRSHPELVGALQVDVILQNNAPFEQTFPVLELTFTNLRSETVATRRLEPEDYLGGELAGRNKMPVRQPIHIALEIVDPGSEAVSYHIKIVD